MNTLLNLLDRIDSFKKIAILLLTGLTMLVLFLGYRLVSSQSVIEAWTYPPKILAISNPCYLVQVRSNIYLVGIDFSSPDYIKDPIEDSVKSSLAAYVTHQKPDQKGLQNLCKSLQLRILDMDSKNWLKFYNKSEEF